jgi:hypothetical protein
LPAPSATCRGFHQEQRALVRQFESPGLRSCARKRPSRSKISDSNSVPGAAPVHRSELRDAASRSRGSCARPPLPEPVGPRTSTEMPTPPMDPLRHDRHLLVAAEISRKRTDGDCLRC